MALRIEPVRDGTFDGPVIAYDVFDGDTPRRRYLREDDAKAFIMTETTQKPIAIITDSDLDAIEARAKAATTGDWATKPVDGASFVYPSAASFNDEPFGVNDDVLRLVAEVRRLNADLFDAERKAVHLAEEVGRLKAEIGGQYRDYNMKVITTDEDGNSVTVYGTLRKELEKR